MREKEHGKKIFLLIFFIFLVIITFLAIIFPQVLSGNKNAKSERDYGLLSIPTVSGVIEDKDGNSHNVKANFTVQVDEEQVDNVDTLTIQAHISEVMENLDYDKVTSSDGSAYIKTEVLTKLAETVPSDKIQGLYLTDFIDGGEKIYSENYENIVDSKSKNDKVLKSLFKKIN